MFPIDILSECEVDIYIELENRETWADETFVIGMRWLSFVSTTYNSTKLDAYPSV